MYQVMKENFTQGLKIKISNLRSKMIILVVMLVAVAEGVTDNIRMLKANEIEQSIINKALVNICEPTDYKEACLKSMALANTTEPSELIKVALMSAREQAHQALEKSIKLEKLWKELRTSQAFKSCNEALNLAMYNIEKTFGKVSSLERSKVGENGNDFESWLSSSFSYSTMCLDAFEDNSTSTVEARNQMEKVIQPTREHTNNALVMIKQYVNSISSKPFVRPVLTDDDGFPTWLDEDRLQLLTVPGSKIQANAIVAKDGSGHFKTLTEALKHVPTRNDGRVHVIYVKAGVYQEYISMGMEKTNIMIIGDGPTRTKFTGSRNYADGVATSLSGTFRVLGDGFIAKNIGFENTAGPQKYQAVALHVSGDKSVIYNCRMDGYQDTLLTAANRQFYRDCTISGTIDFIFGFASVIFQNCNILIRMPMRSQTCTITADGRDNDHLTSGIVIQNSYITAAPDMAPYKRIIKSYLGRPWKPLARTIIMNSKIDDVIHTDGWTPWPSSLHTSTCFFAEFNNKGSGADMNKRVRWVKRIYAGQANQYTVSKFISGDKWIPASGVPFVAGL